MKYQAILFDLDGTLVNSMHQYEAAMVQVCREYGASLTSNEFWELYEQHLHLSEFMQKCGLSADLEQEFRARRDALYVERLKKHVEWYDDAVSFLNSLSVPLGILTSSWRSYTDAIDQKLGIYNHFSVFLTCNDVERCKPDPNGLFLACEQLSVDPTQCIYIGDQHVDRDAAKAAGMPCCIVKRPHASSQAWEGADFIVDSLLECVDFLS